MLLTILILALVCFILAAFKVAFPRIDLVALGMALVTAANIMRVLVPLVIVTLLLFTGCALNYETAKGSKYSFSADPSGKQIRAVGGLLL